MNQPPSLQHARRTIAELAAAGRARDAQNLLDDTLNQVETWLKEALDVDTARAMQARQAALRAMLRTSLAEAEPWAVEQTA